MDTLQEKINALPRLPGCYLFKNKQGSIIYIGKSKALKNRVQQYFQNVEAKEGKYKALYREISDLEIVRTPTERDALILECQLIKRHLPKYNVQLKRKKNYPYICIDLEPEYPTISIATEYQSGKREYFGFFANPDRAFETISLINAIWQTQLCMRSHFPENHRPCLNYHLKKCCAPCSGMVEAALYQKKIREIRRCLKGKSSGIPGKIKRQMKEASQTLQFEKALYYRELLIALEQLQKRSRRLNTFYDKQEVFLFFRGFRETGCALFYIHDGRVKGRMDWDGASLPAFEPFVKQVKTAEIAEDKEQERFLAKCLLEIYADKYYITIPKSARNGQIVIMIERAFQEMDSFT